MISFDSEICSSFTEATSREWLETNGIGGYASGTISGASTRRYHAILTAATKPPLGRITTAAKIEETLIVNGERCDLSSNQYPGKISPEGYKFITSFRLDPFPIWTYNVNGVELEKRVFMVAGENTTVCRWTLLANGGHNIDELSLEVRPLLSFVYYHHLQHEDASFSTGFESRPNVVSVQPYSDMPEVFFIHNGASVNKTGYWYKNFEYAIEKERGFDYAEDLFQPFAITFKLTAPATVVVSTERSAVVDDTVLEKNEVKRRATLVAQAGAVDDFTKQLVLAADQFIAKRGDGETVIAGYPWFSDWGRDTMISLSGLALATNRPEIAKNILLEFSRHLSQGMLPNRFPDVGEEAEYNTVDATLWYFEAIRAYLEKTGDHDFVRQNLYSKLADIIYWHLRGTRYKIHVDTDGLLYAGEPGVQLTWMDAKIGDLVITPRTGKPVEIQALWYNALKIMAGLAERFGDSQDKAKYQSMADLAKLSFNAVFWNEAEQCLYDVVENGNRDGAIRPNQILAASLHYSMLEDARAKLVLEKITAELLTPVGLRSLSPKDPKYCPVDEGSPFERDSAYHQGTVWAWLIGPYIDAYRRVYGASKSTETRVAEILSGFSAHLLQAGLGQISEIFDAEPPHSPRGCFAQAWSVAEVLRVWCK
ncbi:MAG TPA: amylo-alpha-1,6-glucosidase [Pyrinomonadaceae bacterium]|nr:amylo-alpha-1,6-glucosidase [Pyrinomonadaceae bacterium]